MTDRALDWTDTIGGAVAETTRPTRESRIAEIEAGLRLIHPDGGVIEIRALDVPSGGGQWRSTRSGYYDDYGRAASACHALDQMEAGGVYMTLNPVVPGLLARAANKVVSRPQHTTGNAEIVRRQWLFVDIDPHRPSGIAATDEEMETATTLAADVEDLLRPYGFGTPLSGLSGNGALLLYRIDLPNDEATTQLISRCYRGINNLLPGVDLDRPHSTIDLVVGNAARLVRVPHTTNRKGDPTEDRPHRRAMLNPPDPDYPVEVVPLDAIIAVAEHADDHERREPSRKKTQAAAKSRPNGKASSGIRLDVARYLDARGVEHTAKETGDGVMYRVQCPFDGAHGGNGESAVYQADSGLLTYECKHASCQDRTWPDYRDAIGKPEPTHYDGITRQSTAATSQEPEREPIKWDVMTCAELIARKIELRYLVEGVLVAGQPCIIAGSKKTLKTTILLDMALAIATGGYVLGRWRVPTPEMVGVMTGESGLYTVRETALRIADAAHIDATTVDRLVITDSVPRFGHPDHDDALRDLIESRQLRVLFVDPTYLAIGGSDAGNLFAMGAQLRGPSEICQAAGCTLVLVHHTRKNIADPYGQPELEHIAWAGFSEFARQWILLNRREAYQPGTGTHRLWMSVGGSAGHGSLHGLDIEEGVAPDRYWHVDVVPAGDIYETRTTARDRDKAEREQQRHEADRQLVCNVLAKHPDGMTTKDIRSHARLSTDRANMAIASLLDDDMILACDVHKSNRKTPYQGYRLAD